MLYVPRIAFILTVNITFFIFFWVVARTFDYHILSSEHLISYLMFFFLMERTIALFWSKDLGEYSPSFINTIAFVLLSYFVFSFEFIERLILGMPEIILVLIPINFLFGRYK